MVAICKTLMNASEPRLQTAFGRSRAEGESDTTYAQPQFVGVGSGSSLEFYRSQSIIVISTRLFFILPASVSLDATGSLAPFPCVKT